MRVLILFLTAALAWGQAPLGVPVERLVDTALAFARQEAAATGGTYRFSLVQPPRLPALPPGTVSFEASRLSKAEPVGRFFTVVEVKVDGARAATVRVDLDGAWIGTVLRARKDLPRKAELTMDQLEATPFEGVPPVGALGELPPGQRLRGPLSEGRILTRGDLESIPLVQSGDRVKVTCQDQGLTITLEALARSRGGLGEHVRLEAPGSRRTILAVVTGPGEAQLAN